MGIKKLVGYVAHIPYGSLHSIPVSTPDSSLLLSPTLRGNSEGSIPWVHFTCLRDLGSVSVS